MSYAEATPKDLWETHFTCFQALVEAMLKQ
jgi:hypothetical protein